MTFIGYVNRNISGSLLEEIQHFLFLCLKGNLTLSSLIPVDLFDRKNAVNYGIRFLSENEELTSLNQYIQHQTKIAADDILIIYFYLSFRK